MSDISLHIKNVCRQFQTLRLGPNDGIDKAPQVRTCRSVAVFIRKQASKLQTVQMFLSITKKGENILQRPSSSDLFAADSSTSIT